MFAKRAAAEEAVFVAGFVWTLKNHPLSRVIHKQTTTKKHGHGSFVSYTWLNYGKHLF